MRLEKVVEEGGGLIVHLILEPNPPHPPPPWLRAKYATGSYKKFKKYERPIVFNS